MMAEFAINEFDLSNGIVDEVSLASLKRNPQFATAVGPWQAPNEVVRHRALFHANETHRLPLNTHRGVSKKQLLAEILGRTEPAVANRQGIAVGLYRNGEVPSTRGENKDDAGRLTGTLLRPESGHGRSRASLDDLPQAGVRGAPRLLQVPQGHDASPLRWSPFSTKLDPSGFPTAEVRFVLADAFVDAMADLLGGAAAPEHPRWLGALGQMLPREFSTPWERDTELFCSLHRATRNACCAPLTASRAVFILVHALNDLLKSS